MAEAHFLAPTPFLVSPGDPPVSWSRWFSSFQIYMTATGLDDVNVQDGRKRAILIHCLGTEGQRIFHSLGDCPAYQDAVDKIESHFGPRKSVIVQRYRFRSRNQRAGESISSYVATLKELSASCKFGTLTDELVRDQLIEKTTSQRVRERLLMEPDTLTLQQATVLAQQIESAVADSRLIGADSTSTNPIKIKQEQGASVQGIYKGNNGRNRSSNTRNWNKNQHAGKRATQNEILVCRNCGVKNAHKTHDPSCSANGQECTKCHRIGHFQQMCRSCKPASVKQVKSPSIDSGNVSVHTVSDNVTTDNNFKHCTVSVNGIKLNLLIDLGAKVSILNEDLYNQHFRDIPLVPSTQVLTSYNGGSIPIIGVANLPVKYDDQSIQNFPFFIAKRGSSLMGIDLFNKLGFQISRNGATVNSVDLQSVEDQFPQLFTGFGKIVTFEHRPRVDPKIAPVSQNYRRLPLTVRTEVSKELRRLEDLDIIERIDSSPWISNLVVARRTNGDIRLCVDLRDVNKAIIPGKYPLPDLGELTSEFHGSTVFTKLDLRRSYLQVPLAEESKNLTAFITHEGAFRYKRMPYGISSAPSAFQRILASVLNDCEGTVHLIDDVAVHGPTQEEHDRRLNKVLNKLSSYNLTPYNAI